MYVECRLILLIGQNSCGIVSFRCHKNRVGGLLSFKDWCFQVPHCQQVQPGCWPRGRHLPGQGDCVPDRDTLLAERWREHIRHGISYHILNFCCLRKYTAILTQTGNLNNTYDLWMSRYASHSFAQSQKLKRSKIDLPSIILDQLVAKSYDLFATREYTE